MKTLPAFPTAELDGMTLRDWFAGQALAGIVSDSARSTHLDDAMYDDEDVAKINAAWAYQIADAMLAEREKK